MESFGEPNIEGIIRRHAVPKLPCSRQQSGVPVSDYGKLAEFVYRTPAVIGWKQTPKCPPTNNTHHLRFDEFWCMNLGHRTQSLAHGLCAVGYQEKVDGRRRVDHNHFGSAAARSLSSASAADSGTSNFGRLANRSSISFIVGRRAISIASARSNSDSERRSSAARAASR